MQKQMKEDATVHCFIAQIISIFPENTDMGD